jgi:diguanylate cyclase (GGDEF)-like protein
VAHILKSQFRPRDVLIRYGGDEFSVLLPGVDEEQALAIAERVRSTVSGNTADDDDSLIQVPVRISMGIAQLAEDGTLDSLVRAADAALYRAKRAGRDAVSL